MEEQYKLQYDAEKGILLILFSFHKQLYNFLFFFPFADRGLRPFQVF